MQEKKTLLLIITITDFTQSIFIYLFNFFLYNKNRKENTELLLHIAKSGHQQKKIETGGKINQSTVCFIVNLYI